MSTCMTLQYDTADKRAVTMIQLLLTSGLFVEKKKTGMEEAMEDIEFGRIHDMDSVENFINAL